jgi:hypothetical protein
MLHTCLYEGIPCVGCAVLGDDAVNRMMVRVVSTTCMCIWGYTYVGVYKFLIHTMHFHIVGCGLK